MTEFCSFQQIPHSLVTIANPCAKLGHGQSLYKMPALFLPAAWIHLITTSSLDIGHAYLQRGQTGHLRCPLIGSPFAVTDIDSMYWYRQLPDGELLLISNFRGSITHSPGSPSGKYDISDEFALVIDSVKDADGFTYKCKVKPWDLALLDALVNVTVFGELCEVTSLFQH